MRDRTGECGGHLYIWWTIQPLNGYCPDSASGSSLTRTVCFALLGHSLLGFLHRVTLKVVKSQESRTPIEPKRRGPQPDAGNVKHTIQVDVNVTLSLQWNGH